MEEIKKFRLGRFFFVWIFNLFEGIKLFLLDKMELNESCEIFNMFLVLMLVIWVLL